MRASVDALERMQAEIVRLRYFHGLTQVEVAAIGGVVDLLQEPMTALAAVPSHRWHVSAPHLPRLT